MSVESEEYVGRHVYHGTPFAIDMHKQYHGKGFWHTYRIVVLSDDVSIGEFTRNYSSRPIDTFVPFRHNGTWYALYSPKYTATRVARLSDKFEDWCGEEASGCGFCPVEFYAPRRYTYEKLYVDTSGIGKPLMHGLRDSDAESDHEFVSSYSATVAEYAEYKQRKLKAEGIIAPGSVVSVSEILYENFAFIAGCVWGDDNSWKLRYIDLTKVDDKNISVQERFGYWELPRGLRLKQAVKVSGGGKHISLLGSFHMDMSKPHPNPSFVKGFFEHEEEHEEDKTDASR